jgi:hypothetical protein
MSELVDWLRAETELKSKEVPPSSPESEKPQDGSESAGGQG